MGFGFCVNIFDRGKYLEMSVMRGSLSRVSIDIALGVRSLLLGSGGLTAAAAGPEKRCFSGSRYKVFLVFFHFYLPFQMHGIMNEVLIIAIYHMDITTHYPANPRCCVMNCRVPLLLRSAHACWYMDIFLSPAWRHKH